MRAMEEAALDERTSLPAQDPHPGGTRPSQDRKWQKRLEAEQRQARSRQRKAKQELVDRLEAEIAELETRQAELTAELEKPETYNQPGRAVSINRELQCILERLARLTPERETAATQLAEMELSGS